MKIGPELRQARRTVRRELRTQDQGAKFLDQSGAISNELRANRRKRGRNERTETSEVLGGRHEDEYPRSLDTVSLSSLELLKYPTA